MFYSDCLLILQLHGVFKFHLCPGWRWFSLNVFTTYRTTRPALKVHYFGICTVRKWIILRTFRSNFLPPFSKYTVSIKSFPDYKHLLQENYVEYKHIYFFSICNSTQEVFFTTHEYTSTISTSIFHVVFL
jgi:hypothetical protein